MELVVINNYLDKYVEFCEMFYHESFCVVCDMEKNVVFVGTEYLKVIQKRHTEVIGKNIYETTPVPEHNRKISDVAFPEAIKNKQQKQFFIANLNHPYPAYHVLLMLFTPVTNADNIVIATKFEFTPANIAFFFQILIKVNKKIEPNNLPNNDNYLTPKEHQIAFLICHTKDIHEITTIINLFNKKDITEKTVHNIINRYLFTKFNVLNKKELLVKLYELGYDKHMPNSLLSNQFIDLTKS